MEIMSDAARAMSSHAKGSPTAMTDTQTPQTGYAPVNGLQMYYDPRWTARNAIAPAARRLVQLRPTVRRAATQSRRETPGHRHHLQGHGCTNDIDRPLTAADLALRRRWPAAAPRRVTGRRLRVQHRRGSGHRVGSSGTPEPIRKAIISSQSIPSEREIAKRMPTRWER